MATQTLLDQYQKAGHRVHKPEEVRKAQGRLVEGAMAGKPEAHVLGLALVYDRSWLGLSWMAQEWGKIQAALMVGHEPVLSRDQFQRASQTVADDVDLIAADLWRLCGQKGSGDLCLEGIRTALYDGLKAAWGLQQMGPFQDLG